MDNLTKKALDGPFVDELGTSTGPWPRYLVMTSTDGGKILRKLSPFTIHKGVKGIAGEILYSTYQSIKKCIYFFRSSYNLYKKTHGQRVMNYAGATKATTQCTSVCTQTDVSWVGAQPATRKQRPAASVTRRPVPSVSRSVGTTTRVADVQKFVP